MAHDARARSRVERVPLESIEPGAEVSQWSTRGQGALGEVGSFLQSEAQKTRIFWARDRVFRARCSIFQGNGLGRELFDHRGGGDSKPGASELR
jgi:hypothetical protein